MKSMISLNKLWLLPLFILMAGCSKNSEQVKVDTPVPVETASIIFKEIQQPIHTSGVLQSGKTSKLSFKIGGIIEQLAVEDGQTVKKGQLLAGLYQDEIQAQLNNARTQCEKAQRDFERANNLYKDNAISLQHKQDAESGFKAAKATLQIAEFNANRARIYAPNAGKVLTVIGEENEMVDAGVPVIVFASLEQKWVVRVHVADKDVVKLTVGDSATVNLDAFPGKTFAGTIQEITESPDPVTGLYAVELALVKFPERLISGLVATVDIYPSHKTPCYLVPAEALYEARGDRGTILTLDAQNIVRENPVRIIGFYQDMLAVSGKFQDERVITTGASYLDPGDSVMVTDREVVK